MPTTPIKKPQQSQWGCGECIGGKNNGGAKRRREFRHRRKIEWQRWKWRKCRPKTDSHWRKAPLQFGHSNRGRRRSGRGHRQICAAPGPNGHTQSPSMHCAFPFRIDDPVGRQPTIRGQRHSKCHWRRRCDCALGQFPAWAIPSDCEAINGRENGGGNGRNWNDRILKLFIKFMEYVPNGGWNPFCILNLIW